MDAARLLKEIAEGEIGEDIREAHGAEIIRDLRSKDWDNDREWADSVVEYLISNWFGDPDKQS